MATPLLPNRSVCIIQISDLHIAPSAVSEKGVREPLWDQLWRATADAKPLDAVNDLCFVTGDLVSGSPDKTVFAAVRAELDRRFPPRDRKQCPVGDLRQWLVVPGNHDVKRWGNLGVNPSVFQKAFPECLRPWWRPGYPLVVVPLDSNPSQNSGKAIKWAADLARGLLGDQERARLAEALANVEQEVRKYAAAELAKWPDVDVARLALRFVSAFDESDIDHLREVELLHKKPISSRIAAKLSELIGKLFMSRSARCVLMHHHPIGIANTENLGITHQEAYLALNDAGAFLETARANRISLVCHGHKHMHHRVLVGLPGEDREFLGVVGCGSTTYEGKHSRPTANLIEIRREGEVDVRLHHVTDPSFAQAKEPLHLREWRQIKRHLASNAEEHSRISVGSSTVNVRVLATGDALLTVNLRGVRFKKEARNSDGNIFVPIGIGGVQVSDPELRADRGDDPKVDVVGEQSAIAFPSRDGSSWDGYVRFNVTKTDGLNLDLGYRVLVYCAYATNAWQFRCMYGDRDSATERHTWRCSIPVRDRAFLTLQTTGASGLQFASAVPFYCNSDGSEDKPEVEALALEQSSWQDLALVASAPVWGGDYGVRWTWRGVDASLPLSRRNELRRAELEAEMRDTSATRSALRQSLSNVLEAGTSQQKIEATLYLITRDEGRSPAELRQVAWNRLVETKHHHVATFRFGAGVAGRAAWLSEPVGWVAPSSPHRDLESRLADYYLAPAGRRAHTAVLAMPIGGNEPLGVLSLATSADDEFAAMVQQVLTDARAGRRSGYPEWVQNLVRRATELVLGHAS